MGGLFIQCQMCGYTHHISFEKPVEEIGQSIRETISDGWRYASNFDDFICPKCVKDQQDKLFLAFVGKPKIESREGSYLRLVGRVARQAVWLKED